MKKLIISICMILLVFIGTTFMVSYIILHSDKILTSFSIVSVDNVSTKYKIRFERARAAKDYDIVIYNENNSVFYTMNTTKLVNEIDLPNITYDSKYKLVIYANGEHGDTMTVSNPYTFTYTEPTFSKDNNLVLTNNEDYTLKIDGDVSNKNYKITINDGDYKIFEDKVTSNEYVIPSNLYSGLSQKLDVKLFDGVSEINKISLYSNMSPVGDVVITAPEEGKVLNYNDIIFKYEGAENADKVVLDIYNGNRLIKSRTLRSNRAVISSEFFEKSKKYTIKISAMYKEYEDYTKTTIVNFQMNEKDTLKPVFISNYPKYIKKGTKITLSNPNGDGKIYYTTDGSDPAVSGAIYDDPITVNTDFTLKAVVKANKKNDSMVTTYDLHVEEKPELRIYLSPSNQDGNIGVKEVGFTNEAKEMNDVADYVEAELKNYGVKVYRNNPNGNINLWNSEAKYYNCDFKIAIHSNASGAHNTYGIETWIDEEGSLSYSIANIIQEDLMNIYYNKDDEKANRGVKYANGALGEANDRYFPFGLLVEVAHHDYKEDALWIMSNKKLIGKTLADSILKYFDIL